MDNREDNGVVKIKICYVGSAKSIHMQRWAKWFAERGHEVHLISPNYEDIEGVKIHLIGKKKEGSVTNFIRKMFQTRKLVWRIKPDILHAHYAFGHGTFAAFANYHPFVVSCWGDDVLREPYQSLFKRMMIKHTLQKADLVTVWNEYLLNALSGLNIDVSRVVIAKDRPTLPDVFHKNYENEVRLLRKKLQIPKNNKIVLSPRNVHPIYRIHNIVKSAIWVFKKHPDTVFIILKGKAEDNYYNKIVSYIQQSGFENKFRIIDKWLSPTEMAIVYNLADIVVSVAKKDQFAECVEEAMACGAIPIIGKLEIYKKVLRERKNCFFVSGDDPEEIAEKINYCIEHLDLKDEIYKNNIDIIRKRRYFNGPKEILMEYEKLLAERKKPQYKKYM